MILDKFNLKGKTAIITGTTSGIGQAIAVGLASAGCNIFGVGSSPEQNETKKLVEKTGMKFKSITLDLVKCKREELNVIINECLNQFGRIDYLINNAGIIRRNKILDFKEEDWDDVLEINLNKTFFLSKLFSKHLISKEKTGKIVNIASMLSYQGGLYVPSYTASKFAVKGLTMSLANELAEHGINVNAIAPGYILTNNTKKIVQDEIRYKSILDRIPIKRWGTPEDLSGSVVFLCSENSNYINGFTLAVDGGYLGR